MAERDNFMTERETLGLTLFEKAFSGRGLRNTVNRDFRSQNLHQMVDEGGRNALHWAAIGGDLESVKFLLNEKNMILKSTDYRGWTPLAYAILGSKKTVMNHLISRDKSQLNPVTDRDNNLLIFAVLRDNIPMMHSLLAKGCEVNTIIPISALQGAATRGDDKMIEALVFKKAKFSDGLEGSKTPIVHAILHMKKKCVNTILTKQGVEAVDKATYSDFNLKPLFYLASMKPFPEKVKMIKDLIRTGANPDDLDRHDLTPLEAAVLKFDLKSTQHLVEVTTVLGDVSGWNLLEIRTIIANKKEDILSKGLALYGRIMTVANEHMSAENYLVASNYYELALDVKPRDLEALSRKSICWARLNLSAYALLKAHSCVATDMYSPVGYLRLSEACRLQNRHRSARMFVSNGLELIPDNLELTEELGRCDESAEEGWLFIPLSPQYTSLIKSAKLDQFQDPY